MPISAGKAIKSEMISIMGYHNNKSDLRITFNLNALHSSLACEIQGTGVNGHMSVNMEANCLA